MTPPATSNKASFGVYSKVTITEAYPELGGDGYRSVVLYTARPDSMYGQSAGVYWNLTPEEATQLGVALIEQAARCVQ